MVIVLRLSIYVKPLLANNISNIIDRKIYLAKRADTFVALVMHVSRLYQCKCD